MIFRLLATMAGWLVVPLDGKEEKRHKEKAQCVRAEVGLTQGKTIRWFSLEIL